MMTSEPLKQAAVVPEFPQIFIQVGEDVADGLRGCVGDLRRALRSAFPGVHILECRSDESIGDVSRAPLIRISPRNPFRRIPCPGVLLSMQNTSRDQLTQVLVGWIQRVLSAEIV